MIGFLLALLILLVAAVHWRWAIHAGPLYVDLNSSFWSRPFATEHGPQSLPWWQPVKVMPWRTLGGGWNVFVYTRRTTRCHYVVTRRPRHCRSWALYCDGAVRDWRIDR